MPRDKGESVELEVQRHWRAMTKSRSRIDNASKKELDFALRLAHYVSSTDNELDQRRMQPRGQQLYSLLRRKMGEIARSQTSVQVRPRDRLQDPRRAEYVKWALEYIKTDPYKDYTSARDRLVLGALAARGWAIAIDYDPAMGYFGGEIQFRSLPPWHLHWTDGYFNPHDPRCPEVIEDVDMTRAEIESQTGWDVDFDELQPDNGRPFPNAANDVPLPPGQVSLKNFAQSGDNEEPTYKILKVWRRNDKTRKAKPRPNTMRELDPEDYFIGCEACGYRGPSQSEIAEPIPDEIGPCPDCGEPLTRMEFEEEVDIYSGYPNGRYLVVPAFGIKKVYDSDWPNRTRSVPFYWWTAYVDPTEVVGQSDTNLNKTSQQMSNGLDRMAYEQMQENRSYYKIPKGVEDFAGRPFVMADAQGRTMFVNEDYDPQRTGGIEQFQGAGISRDWAVLKQSVTQDMVEFQGSTDLGLQSGDTKDIAVGTIERLMQSVSVPTEHHVRRLLLSESQGDGVLLDIVRDTWTEARWVRYLAGDGKEAFKSIRGADIPGADVIVSSAPQMEAIDQDKVRAFMLLRDPTMAPYRRALAHFLHIDPSTVEMIEEAEKSVQPTGVQPQQPTAGGLGGGNPDIEALLTQIFGGNSNV